MKKKFAGIGVTFIALALLLSLPLGSHFEKNNSSNQRITGDSGVALASEVGIFDEENFWEQLDSSSVGLGGYIALDTDSPKTYDPIEELVNYSAARDAADLTVGGGVQAAAATAPKSSRSRTSAMGSSSGGGGALFLGLASAVGNDGGSSYFPSSSSNWNNNNNDSGNYFPPPPGNDDLIVDDDDGDGDNNDNSIPDNSNTVTVPVPAAVFLAIMGIGALGFRRDLKTH